MLGAEPTYDWKNEMEILYVLDGAALLHRDRTMTLEGRFGAYTGDALSHTELREAIGLSASELDKWLAPLLKDEAIDTAQHRDDRGETEMYYFPTIASDMYWNMVGSHPDEWWEEHRRLDAKYKALFERAGPPPAETTRAYSGPNPRPKSLRDRMRSRLRRLW